MLSALMQRVYMGFYCALQHFFALHNKIYFQEWDNWGQELTLE